jgi:hypothetical protein
MAIKKMVKELGKKFRSDLANAKPLFVHRTRPVERLQGGRLAIG